MAEMEEKKAEDKVSRAPADLDYGGGKKKIIVIAVVAIVVIALLAYVFLLGDDNGNGNGGNGNGNQPPNGEIVMTQEDFFVNKLIYFNSTSSDPNNDDLSFKWDFGDGKTSNKANATHTYDLAGTYNVTFTVTDVHDEKDEDSLTIEVLDIPDISMSVVNTQIIPGQPPIFSVTIDSMEPSIVNNLAHFYVIDGDTQSTLIEGNVAAYVTPPPHEYVNYYDNTPAGNLSADDSFTITDSGSFNPLGISDGDIFRLTMEESDDLIGEIILA
jgi:PKD repeat protein